MSEVVPLPWHQALAYALLGWRMTALGVQARPEPQALLAELTVVTPGGADGLGAQIARLQHSGPWPLPLPDDLRRCLGPAQFAAALADLRALLPPASTRSMVDRPLDPAERSLLRELPPHHVN